MQVSGSFLHLITHTVERTLNSCTTITQDYSGENIIWQHKIASQYHSQFTHCNCNENTNSCLRSHPMVITSHSHNNTVYSWHVTRDLLPPRRTPRSASAGPRTARPAWWGPPAGGRAAPPPRLSCPRAGGWQARLAKIFLIEEKILHVTIEACCLGNYLLLWPPLIISRN